VSTVLPTTAVLPTSTVLILLYSLCGMPCICCYTCTCTCCACTCTSICTCICACVLWPTSRADLPSSCRSVPVKKAPCLPGAEGRPIGVASTAILESVTYKVL
jgi:hypothetical protein